MESERWRAKLSLAHDIPIADMAPMSLLLERALEQGLREVRSESWATAETSLDPVGDPLLRVSAEGRESALYDLDGVLLAVSLCGGHVGAVAAAEEPDAIAATFRFLRERLGPPDPSASHEVPVTFWTYSPHGPQPAWRSISVPGWDDISDNYSAATRTKLEEIMHDFEPAHGGQLVLWHGSAGTGKTFALRALAWEWRDWCEFHYIVDPDSFFGQHADYLMSVLLQPGPMIALRHGAGVWMSTTFEMELDEEEEGAKERAWRLLVLEDTGELLSADARAALGQGLSRFLNVVDGLIGQGLRVLVLVTTNEEIRKLHPAVSRPGRCAADIEFETLSPDEASAWLSRHGLDERERPAPTLLASLYARLEGRDPAEVVSVGFGGWR